MLNKKQVYCIATVLVLTILSVTMFNVVAQVGESTSTFDAQPSSCPTEKYVNPVEDKINEFRAQGLTDEQITIELEKLGMRWPPYPMGNAVDPVDDAIKEFRSQGLTDEQIVQELEKLGMGWIPETGSSWVGIIDNTYRPHGNPFHR
jgi:hypothetical protein